MQSDDVHVHGPPLASQPAPQPQQAPQPQLPAPIIFVEPPGDTPPAPGAFKSVAEALASINCAGTVVLRQGIHLLDKFLVLKPPPGGALALVGEVGSDGQLPEIRRASATGTPEAIRISARECQVLLSRLAIEGTVYLEGMSSGGHVVGVEACLIDGAGVAGLVDGYARDRPGRLHVFRSRLQNCSTGLFSMRVDGALRVEGCEFLDCRAGVVVGALAAAEVEYCRFERMAAAGVMTAGASRGVRVSACGFFECAEAIEDRSGRVSQKGNEGVDEAALLASALTALGLGPGG